MVSIQFVSVCIIPVMYPYRPSVFDCNGPHTTDPAMLYTFFFMFSNALLTSFYIESKILKLFSPSTCIVYDRVIVYVDFYVCFVNTNYSKCGVSVIIVFDTELDHVESRGAVKNKTQFQRE